MTDDQREQLLDHWEESAPGWARQAESFSEAVAPVTAAMLERAVLAPGTRVLELAGGPGDLSLAAAALVAPTQVLCTDGVQAMVGVARDRAAEEGVENITFQRVQLEWIDLPAAAADVIFCRYGLMLAVDPEAALRECRRVLAPGGRLVVAVQGPAVENPWVTAPMQVATDLGLLAESSAAGPTGPGPFSLAAEGQLAELMGDTGFFDVEVTRIPFAWHYRDERAWIGEKVDHTASFAAMWRGLDDARRGSLRDGLRTVAESFAQSDGSLVIPGVALVAFADA